MSISRMYRYFEEKVWNKRNNYVDHMWLCCVAIVKCRPGFISVLLYFSWSFGINDSNTFSIENWIQLKLVLGAWGDVALFIIMNRLHKTESAIFIPLFWFGFSKGGRPFAIIFNNKQNSVHGYCLSITFWHDLFDTINRYLAANKVILDKHYYSSYMYKCCY